MRTVAVVSVVVGYAVASGIVFFTAGPVMSRRDRWKCIVFMLSLSLASVGCGYLAGAAR